MIKDEIIQKFIKKFILFHKGVISLRKDDNFPSFNQMIKLIIESMAYTDKKLYEKYLGFKNNNNLSLLIKLCNIDFRNSEIETSTYVLRELYGNKKDFYNYQKRRKLEGSSHY